MGFATEFREFASKGNVIDLAVGVIIGAAFTKIVTSLVEGILMPFVGLITGRIDFAGMFYVLDKSKGLPVSRGALTTSEEGATTEARQVAGLGREGSVRRSTAGRPSPASRRTAPGRW